MQTGTLTIEDASAIAQAAIKGAKEREFALAIAIVDPGGWSHVQLRMDGAFPAAIDAALAKAKSAALFRRPTSEFSRRVKDGMPLGIGRAHV